MQHISNMMMKYPTDAHDALACFSMTHHEMYLPQPPKRKGRVKFSSIPHCVFPIDFPMFSQYFSQIFSQHYFSQIFSQIFFPDIFPDIFPRYFPRYFPNIIFPRYFPRYWKNIPSGKRWHSYGKSLFLMGKSTISMAIFNSYVKLPEGISH